MSSQFYTKTVAHEQPIAASHEQQQNARRARRLCHSHGSRTSCWLAAPQYLFRNTGIVEPLDLRRFARGRGGACRSIGSTNLAFLKQALPQAFCGSAQAALDRWWLTDSVAARRIVIYGPPHFGRH